jgi:hypothetical protein
MEHGRSEPQLSPLRPDYSRSIVNLSSGLVRAAGGGRQEYASLAELRAADLSGRPIVLLVVDGLGDVFLRGRPDSFLHQQRRGRLSSVFPTTTATAITSYFTGVAPQQHGITGWFTYFRELGAVATILPFIPRFGGAGLSGAGISPAQLIGRESLLNSLDVPCHVLLPGYLLDSSYSRTLSGRGRRHGCGSLADMFSRLEALTQEQGSSLIIAYWPELDSLAHEHGIAGDRPAEHFLELDRGCRDTLTRIAGRGAAVIVSSDHGLIDTDPEHTVSLDDHPELAAALTLPLCGEPRCAYCYVRSDRREDFEGYIAERLGHACELKKSGELIDQGYFGTGTPWPRFTERIGEYVLLMKEHYVIRDRLLTEKNYCQKGVHGGLSAEELYVPLIMVEV